MAEKIINLKVNGTWMPDQPPYTLPEGAVQQAYGVTSKPGFIRGMAQRVNYTGVVSGVPRVIATFRHSTGLTYTFLLCRDPNTTFGGSILRINPDASITDVTPLGEGFTLSSIPSYGLGLSSPTGQNSITQANDSVIVTGGQGGPLYLPDMAASSAFVRLPGNPPSAKYCCFHKNILLFANCYPNLFRAGNTKIGSTGFDYKIAGITYTVALDTVGTALPAGTIPADKWGVYKLSVDAAGARTVTAGAANYTTGYATEAIALNNIPATPANQVSAGYFVIKTAAGLAFIAGTDALYGGVGGNVASATHYYGYDDPYAREQKKVVWSDAGNIGSWTPSVTSLAGFETLLALRGNILGIQEIGSGISVFAEAGIHNGVYSQYPATFTFYSVKTQHDFLPGSVIPVSGGAFLWTKNNIVFFDGQQITEVGQGMSTLIKTVLTQQDNPTAVAHDASNGIVYWLLSGAFVTDSYILAYNYNTRHLSKLSAGGLYCCIGMMYQAGNPGIYPASLVYLDNNAYTNPLSFYVGADDPNAFVQSAEFCAPDKSLFTVLGIRPIIHNRTASVTVTLYSRKNENDTATQTVFTLPTNKETGWADLRVSGRYFSVKTTIGGGLIESIDVKIADDSMGR